MRIVFVSNFLNHHQIPFCESLRTQCDEFFFIATEISGSQGFQVSQKRDYVIDWHTEKTVAESLIITADVVIFGACPNELIALRMREHKLSFLFSERFFKKGTWRRFIPTTRKTVHDRIIRYKDEPMYVLCASAYLVHDLELLGFPKEKCYRWGYFPEVKKYDDLEKNIGLKHPASILWVARLIGLKHPELPIKVARRLKTEGYTFTLNLIGSGEMQESLRKMISDYDVSDCVYMHGGMKPTEVREYMEKSQIFLFTSDRNEGWGAVMNESMNSGCAVVANRAIGSVPYLLKHGENGLIYDNEEELYQSVKLLLDRPEQCVSFGKAAYQTMIEAWNADEAAKRLMKLIDEVNAHGECDLFENGPCSREKSK